MRYRESHLINAPLAAMPRLALLPCNPPVADETFAPRQRLHIHPTGRVGIRCREAGNDALSNPLPSNSAYASAQRGRVGIRCEGRRRENEAVLSWLPHRQQATLPSAASHEAPQQSPRRARCVFGLPSGAKANPNDSPSCLPKGRGQYSFGLEGCLQRLTCIPSTTPSDLAYILRLPLRKTISSSPPDPFPSLPYPAYHILTFLAA
ncbi:hypothetical protein SODALDRAFT_359215 [Sodiomyces alkalinus F11]|uniref:Uncharacterized protein n=1 Tax=Sodiomyces alkalinus (strain CBS 110278 / VKM F-3762 / F11) TaxID=1314773 RepID=A0A3N2PXT1_SODAK|nr:hypothetical protein SODALDRAFT_359215 [Sodiomyces alkalinus F11]ROT39331.1 hypothetical protein SODALDRAFT_359215 [Sodiomyces alkalinus F11]